MKTTLTMTVLLLSAILLIGCNVTINVPPSSNPPANTAAPPSGPAPVAPQDTLNPEARAYLDMTEALTKEMIAMDGLQSQWREQLSAAESSAGDPVTASRLLALQCEYTAKANALQKTVIEMQGYVRANAQKLSVMPQFDQEKELQSLESWAAQTQETARGMENAIQIMYTACDNSGCRTAPHSC